MRVQEEVKTKLKVTGGSNPCFYTKKAVLSQSLSGPPLNFFPDRSKSTWPPEFQSSPKSIPYGKSQKAADTAII